MNDVCPETQAGHFQNEKEEKRKIDNDYQVS